MWKSVNLSGFAEWFEDAQDEAARASASVERGDYVYAAFHSEQAVEKALKAFLLKQSASLRTHDISTLLGEAKRRTLAVSQELEAVLSELTVHYVAARYPDARASMGLRKSHYTRQLAQRYFEAVRALLEDVAKALQDPPRFGLHETGLNMDELVNAYLSQLKSKHGIRGVVVYGSRAKDSWKLWSDVDVLVVADELPVGFERWRLLYAPLIDPRGYTVQEIEKALDSLDITVLDALFEGVAVYDDGVVAELKKRLESYIQQGLIANVGSGWVKTKTATTIPRKG